MVRLTRQNYQRRVMVVMAIYVAAILWAWPLARAADQIWLKTSYALVPVVPLVYVIWLMARRVLSSDELEQRTHLIGLGVAAAVVSILCIVGGFLAAAKVLTLEWTAVLLIWVFPLMMIVYAAARSVAARRYGGGGCDDEGIPRAIRFLYAAAVMAAVAAYMYFRKGDQESVGLAGGTAIGLAVSGLFLAIRRKWHQRASPE